MNEENAQKFIKEFMDSGMPYWEQKSSEGYKIRIERINSETYQELKSEMLKEAK